MRRGDRRHLLGVAVVVMTVAALVGSTLPSTPAASAGETARFRLYPYAQHPLPSSDRLFVTASTAVADVTGDGRNDVLATSHHYRNPDVKQARLYIFRQRPNHQLAKASWLPLRSLGLSLDVDAGDLDGDGDTDAAVATNEGIKILRQRRGGLRLTRTIAPFADTSTFYAILVKIVDLNRDGRADLVGQFGNRLVLLRQQRRGRFKMVRSLKNRIALEIEIGDVAGNRLLDIVTFERRRCGFQVYRQTRPFRLIRDRVGPCGDGIAVGDVTGDGRDDVVQTYGGNSPQARVAVFKQKRRGGFRRKTTSVYDIPQSVEVSDLDRDGTGEVVMVHDGWDAVGVVDVRRDGSGRRALLVKSSTNSVSATGLALGDFDGDRTPDVAIAAGYNQLVVHHSRTPRCFGAKATVVGSAESEQLSGTSGADVIWSGGNDDRIKAGGGDDKVCTGDGSDAVSAGAGDDRVALGAGADFVEPGAGSDLVRGAGGTDLVSFSRASSVRVDLGRNKATGQGSDRLLSIEGALGSRGADVMFGSKRADFLFGNRGDDTLRGGDGDDVLQPHEGNDVVAGQDGTDTVTFNDTFAADDSTPVMVDLAAETATGHGTDRLETVENIIGSASGDLLAGDEAPNAIYGISGHDEIVGRGGNDILGPGVGTDRVDGGEGSDWVDYSFGDYYGGFDVDIDLRSGTADYGEGHPGPQTLISIENVIGSRGINRITGDEGPNQLLGLEDDDWVDGLGGDDLLDGGTGRGFDRLNGGDGSDRCLEGEELTNCEAEQSHAAPTTVPHEWASLLDLLSQVPSLER